VLTAAAAAVAVTFVALPGEETNGTPQAGDTAPNTSQGDEPPLVVEGEPSLGALQGHDDYGPFGDQQGLKDCLIDLGIDNPQVIGAREAMVDDDEGVAALLAGGQDGHKFRVVVVDPSCTSIIKDNSLG
jgi:hypothetical protein